MSGVFEIAAIAELAQRCAQAFAGGRIDEDAIRFHPQIEALAARAEADGRSALAATALELAVLLGSLIDSASPPGAAALGRLAALCEALQAAAEPPAAGSEGRPRAPLPRVLQLVVEPGSQLELAYELGQRRLRVERASSLDELSQRLAAESADLLLIDSYWLDRAAEVMLTIERGSNHPLHELGYVAMIDRDDRARRMFALRAGIDRVLDLAGPAETAAAVAEFVAERRRAAYRVLLVEDDRAQALFVSSVLGHRGIETTVASSAGEALQIVAELRPDLFLLDLHLPDRNGIELAQLLRERPGLDLVPIVFLSGEPSMEEHFRAMRLGGDAWIAKPVKPRHLLSVVESRAERARRLRARGVAVTGSNESRAGMLSRARLVEMLGPAAGGGLIPRLLLAVAPVDMPGAERGVDFVAQGRLSEDIAQFLATHPLGRLGVCQPAPFLSLLVVEIDAGEALSALVALQEALSGFGWLSRETPTQLPFALGAVALDRAGADANELIAQAQQQLARARSGPGRVQLVLAQSGGEPSSEMLLRDVFARDALASHLTLSYRPLQPLCGDRRGQFVVAFSLQSDGAIVDAATCRQFARRHGLAVRLDQALLVRALGELRLRAERGQDCVLGVPVNEPALEDERFVAWLRAELQRQQIAASALTLWVDADALRGSPARAQTLLRPLADAGLQVVVGPLTDGPIDHDLLQLSEIGTVFCEVDGVGLPAHSIRSAIELGKRVVVGRVESRVVRDALLELGVDYGVGAAIAFAPGE